MRKSSWGPRSWPGTSVLTMQNRVVSPPDSITRTAGTRRPSVRRQVSRAFSELADDHSRFSDDLHVTLQKSTSTRRSQRRARLIRRNRCPHAYGKTPRRKSARRFGVYLGFAASVTGASLVMRISDAIPKLFDTVMCFLHTGRLTLNQRNTLQLELLLL